MNCNEVTHEIMRVLQTTVEPVVTEYIQQHPEYFNECNCGHGYICDVGVSLSYQPDKLTDVEHVQPSIFVHLGDCNKGHALACYEHHPYDNRSTFWIDGEIVSDRKVSGGKYE